MFDDVLLKKRDQILKAAIKHGIKNIRILDSIDVEHSEDHLNLLVDIEKGRSLFDLIGFKHAVEDMFCVKVEVVTEKSIHHSIREELLNKAIKL